MTQVESELGRGTVRVYDDFAASLQPKERISSLSYQLLSARLCTKLSYREAVQTLNLFLHRDKDEDAVKVRTLSDAIERTGAEISAVLSQNAEKILESNGFDKETGLLVDNRELSTNIMGSVSAEPDTDTLQTIIDDINAHREEQIPFCASELDTEMDSSESVYVSIDDIGVKHQKESRAAGSERQGKYVENTVVHIQYGESTYTLTGTCMCDVMKSVLAFLLVNGLLKNRLVFFTDGARNIKNNIDTLFSFHSYTVILDWYHLKKKCQELLSMALKGRDIRNSVLEKLLRILWVGDVQGATQYLNSLSESMIKNKKYLDEQIGYLERKASSIPCYAVRAALKLRNSSNSVEKENDILVAQRQKNNGMSWSKCGSGALAAIEMVFQNSAENAWFRMRHIPFYFSSATDCDLCA